MEIMFYDLVSEKKKYSKKVNLCCVSYLFVCLLILWPFSRPLAGLTSFDRFNAHA